MPWSRDQVRSRGILGQLFALQLAAPSCLRWQKWLRFIVYNHPDTSGYPNWQAVTNPAQVMLNIAMNTRKLGDRSFATRRTKLSKSLPHTLLSTRGASSRLTAKSRSTRARARSDAHTLRYITYEPWLVGVYAKYTTLGLGQEVCSLENPSLRSGFRLDKLPLTSTSGGIFGIHTSSQIIYIICIQFRE